LVIDDGSTDRTADITRSFYRSDRNINLYSKDNGGKASAQNLGLRHAKGDFILITDADAIVGIDWIKKMVADLENYDMVIGSYYAKDIKTWLEKIQQAHYLIKFKYGGSRGIPPAGVNNAFRKEIIESIGVFNETTTSITEDYIQRAIRHGLKIFFDPNIVVLTKCTNNLLGFFAQKLRWREINSNAIFSLSFCYSYGLSFLLFGSLLISICIQNAMIFILGLLVVYLLSFSIFLTPFCKLVFNKDDRHYTIYFIMYEFVEMGVRLLLVPYIIRNLIRPRKGPTFSARRT
jgi:cellulose synthase/poly-beta-1,6-N-acetylglucosamine synthase-like glycosyltransferase